MASTVEWDVVFRKTDDEHPTSLIGGICQLLDARPPGTRKQNTLLAHDHETTTTTATMATINTVASAVTTMLAMAGR
jgi:hypothetical protein